MKKLEIDLEKCTGCRTCELACSFQRYGIFNPTKSAIRVVKQEIIGLDAPVVCQFCDNPVCVNACPEGALEVDQLLGFIKLDSSKCTGCGLCAQACPFGAINFHKDFKTPIICDLCGGSPACVEWCSTGALTYLTIPVSENIQSKRIKTALRQFRPFQERWDKKSKII